MSKDIGKCIWNEPIKKWVKSLEGNMRGISLHARECLNCDGYVTICDRYNEGLTKKKKANWLGLNGDYTK